jgi:hypothetical protein
LAGLLVVSMAALAGAQAPQRVTVQVLVSQISDGAGGIDPKGERLHAKLQGEFRYSSLKVLKQQELRLNLDEVGSVSLPNGKQLRVRPLQVGDDGGALLAVDVEGAVRTDLRVHKGHLVVIGAERYDDGKLVIGLEASW